MLSGGDGQALEAAPTQQMEPLTPVQLSQDEVTVHGTQERKQYLQECCAVIQECGQQLEMARAEYSQVTEYLTDIQRIERIDGEDKESLMELCKRIHRLLQERDQYKNRTLTITQRQMRRFDRYQENLIDEIRGMYEKEMYQKAIDHDIRHLEAEKTLIREEQHATVRKQAFLKRLAVSAAVLVVSLVVLFVLLYFYVDARMVYPYAGTLALAAVFAMVILAESGKNRYEMALSEKKWTKAVTLLNRTKIKYVNNVSVLEYDREKFGVRDAAEFEMLWGEYCKTKEYERRFRENTEQLSRSSRALEQLLDSYGVTDTEVWLVQTYAILDAREMVEIRHDLNQRRQRLREQIRYNEEQKKEYEKKIKTLDK